jgi:anti-anti-sigma factor
METNRPVVVKRIPERLNLKLARAFMREIDPILNSDRPQIVFDCSQVRRIDAAGVEMLLHCLSQVIRRDGDLKLAALSPQTAVLLEITRTDRLFEIYDSISDAVLSFSRFLPAAIKHPAPITMPGVAQLPAPSAPLAPMPSDNAEGGAPADLAA